MKFEELNFNELAEKGNNSIQAIINFGDTGYSMSVIRMPGSYGFELERYELGIFRNNKLINFPPITYEDDTVRGYLKPHEIEKYINLMSTILGENPDNCS
jgi:hypothetical protein